MKLKKDLETVKNKSAEIIEKAVKDSEIFKEVLDRQKNTVMDDVKMMVWIQNHKSVKNLILYHIVKEY